MSVETEAMRLAKALAPDEGPKAARDIYATIGLSGGEYYAVFDGSEEHTPITSAVEVHHGDRVIVHVNGNRAVVVSNLSVPSVNDEEYAQVKNIAQEADELLDGVAEAAATADKTVAQILTASNTANGYVASMKSAADTAGTTLAQIVSDADSAAETLSGMQAAATAANTTLNGIYQDAEDAASAATAAQYRLSDVENVVGTLNWIAEHGEYENQTGKTFDSSKIYYTLSGGTYALTSDTDVKQHKQYYALSSGSYVPVTNPVAADIGSYYERSGATASVVSDPKAADIATYYLLYVGESVQNYINSHLWLDSYGLNLSVDSANGWRIHQGTVDGSHAIGTYILNPSGAAIMAMNANGITIGKSGESRMELDKYGLSIIDDEGDYFFEAIDLRNGNGFTYYHAMNYITEINNQTVYSTPLHPTEIGLVFINGTEVSIQEHGSDFYDLITISSSGATGTYVITFPSNVISIAKGSTVRICYYTDDQKCKALRFGLNSSQVGDTFGPLAAAFGLGSECEGIASFAEGSQTKASGNYSHAEGYYTKATGHASHAEGGPASQADGIYSHSEGMSGAFGFASHSEGGGMEVNHYPLALGDYSHVQNQGTRAASDSQTAIGKFNIVDANDTYALIIGNGTSHNARSDAARMDWSGNVLIDGDVQDLSGNKLYAKQLANIDVKLTPNETSVASSSWTTIGSHTIPAGTWMLTVGVEFPSNSTGRRIGLLTTSSTGSTFTADQHSFAIAPVNGGLTKETIPAIVSFSTATTMYLRVWQNSGSTMDVQARLRGIGLG